MSALLLPLILAIFTVVITFEQKKESDQQRFEDRELGREQRQQDLNVSLEQRNLERQLAEREKYLSPVYQQAAVMFCDLHDTPGRMLEKGVIQVS